MGPEMSEALNDQLERYSENVLRKARNTVKRYGVRRDLQDEGVWWVLSNRNDGTQYRVKLIQDLYMTCACENGKNLGGEPICYHTAAVLLKIGYENNRRTRLD